MPTISPLALRADRLNRLLQMLDVVPEEWRGYIDKEKSLKCQRCDKWDDLIESWQRAMEWTDGLDYALSIMLAAVVSTKTQGEQLWIKVLSPPASGKSRLCEALSVNSEYVFPKSTFRGFLSGWRKGKTDSSLIPLVAGKTLVVKDGDSLLRAPNLPQILSEGRDLYDGVSRSHYRNLAGKDYAGVRFTWILCGTSALRQLDSSELGARFLDCVLMGEIDDEIEDNIVWKAMTQASSNVCIEADGKPESQIEPSMVEAYRRTGGYVGYLREHAVELISRVVLGDSEKRFCGTLAMFVAHFRARPSRVQDEQTGERELSSRLSIQLIRLAKCLAVALGKSVVDSFVMSRVRQVALDTARGRTLDIANYLRQHPEGGEIQAIAAAMNFPWEKIVVLLQFMRSIKVVEAVSFEKNKGTRWGLTRRMQEVYDKVVG